VFVGVTRRYFRSFRKVSCDDLAAPHPQLISLADFEQAAEAVIEAGAFGYYFGGADDEVTLRDNVAAWRRLAIQPRVLVGVSERSASVTLLGRSRPHPLLIAPMAHQRMAHPEGEIATARAAASTGTVMCLSTLATAGVQELADAVPEASRWFQLYVFADRGVSDELVAQAAEYGYEALVVTVDLPISGHRERDLRSGVQSPSPDLVRIARAAGAKGAMTPRDFAALVDPRLSWTDIERLASDSPLPLIVKGVLRPADARLAGQHGARAVVVSNHGGRQLDTVLSGADALPAVLDAVGAELDVIVDGGIRRGTDVLKALALGAWAVMVGRPVLWGLAVGGADGARRVLEILLAELDTALALAGAPRAADLDRSFVMRAPWVSP
jgi:isopentenyl diphosphate isomerase/L-lactate dehydrogenase-like FMN-dependent dehydrogenase